MTFYHSLTLLSFQLFRCSPLKKSSCPCPCLRAEALRLPARSRSGEGRARKRVPLNPLGPKTPCFPPTDWGRGRRVRKSPKNKKPIRFQNRLWGDPKILIISSPCGAGLEILADLNLCLLLGFLLFYTSIQATFP